MPQPRTSQGQTNDGFIPVPKRNVWRALFDIRPAGTILEARQKAMYHLDLRLAQFIAPGGAQFIAPVDKARKFRINVFFPRLLQAAFATVAVMAFLTGIIWAGNAGTAYIESRKATIAEKTREVTALAEEAILMMSAMRFDEARDKFETASKELRAFKQVMRPAVLAASFSAVFLPENDYYQALTMLREVEMALDSAAHFNASLYQLALAAPAAISPGGESILPYLEAIQGDLRQLDFVLGNLALKRNNFSERSANDFLGRVPEIRLSLQKTTQSMDFLKAFLGERESSEILFLFQNPAEIRATGGAIEAYAILSIEQGRVVQFHAESIKHLGREENESYLLALAPPRPLGLLSLDWRLEDANWFFDFGLSAKKVSEFFYRIDQRKFDMVVAVNFNTVADLVNLVESITFESREGEVTVTPQNFWGKVESQNRLLSRNDRASEEDHFVAMLAPHLLNEMSRLDLDDIPMLSLAFGEGLLRRNILMWSPDSDLQEFILFRGWGGAVVEIASDEDYLAVALTSIGGARVDDRISNTYHLKTEIEPAGGIINHLTITRAYAAGRPAAGRRTLRNLTYIRVFVPSGSTLIGIRGASPEPVMQNNNDDDDYAMDDYLLDEDVIMTIGSAFQVDGKAAQIFEESGRTVFGFWQALSPGQTRAITLSWQLPFRANFAPPRYGFLFQKQPGSTVSFRHDLLLPYESSIVSAKPFDLNIIDTADGEKFSWESEQVLHDIRQIILYQLRSR